MPTLSKIDPLYQEMFKVAKELLLESKSSLNIQLPRKARENGFEGLPEDLRQLCLLVCDHMIGQKAYWPSAKEVSEAFFDAGDELKMIEYVDYTD